MSLQYLQNAVKDHSIQSMIFTIRKSEGTDAADGFNYLFGSSPHNALRFTDMSKHPNIHRPFGNTTSTAAGVLQIMYHTDLELTAQLVNMGMTQEEAQSFTPEMQILKGVLLFSNHDCCQLIIDGHFEKAINILNKTWASLPGSPYGQPVHTMALVKEWYTSAGGTITA